jgi:hypothetical protein
VLLVAGCALGAVLWQRSADSTRAALVLAHDVSRGHVFEPADFVPAQVRATGVHLLPYEAGARMIGRIAVADLSAHTPVTESVAVETVPLGDGEGLVGRRLAAGEYPDALRAGDHVQVVLVAPTSTSAAGPVGSAATPPSVEDATVESVVPLTGAADAVVVTLRMPSADARRVAASTGVRLVQVGV